MKGRSARPARPPGWTGRRRKTGRLAFPGEDAVYEGARNQDNHRVHQAADEERDEGEREEDHAGPERREHPCEDLHGHRLPRLEAVSYAAQCRDRNRRGHRPVTAFLHEVNRMRTLPLVSLAALLAAPLAAQGKPSDPDVKAAGGGTLPAGWTSRLDDTTAKQADVKFVTMGPGGLHFTSGPAGIYWRDADAATGSFHTVATFTQTKAPMPPEAYGIFVAGKDLKGAGQSYVYFLVRGDGQYTIRQRQGGTVTNITTGNRNGWSPNDAVAKQDSATGQAP